MLKLRTNFFASVALVALMSCGHTDSKPVAHADSVATTPAAQTQLATIAIPTAKCENCEKTIHDAVQKVDGVTDVKVDAKAHTASVHFIAARTNVGALETAISKAGYTANATQRDKAGYDNLESCCK